MIGIGIGSINPEKVNMREPEIIERFRILIQDIK